MQIRLHARGVPFTGHLAREAERRAGRAVARFARGVSAIGVQLFDLNGPRGGVDKACEVSVSLGRAGTVRYRAVASSTAAAIKEAIAGAAEAVARRLAFRRDVRREMQRRSRALRRALA